MLFAFVVGMGAVAEIAVAIHPALLPTELDRLPFMAAHHTSPLLRTWILVSNAIDLACALVIASASTWRRVRTGARVLGAVAMCGIGVCLPFLLPLPSEGELRTVGVVMLASVIAASVGIAVACALIARVASLREAITAS